jgi:hypothetical protein
MVINAQDKCPKCASENIHNGKFGKDGNWVYQKCLCNDCDTAFEPYYKFDFIGEVHV